MNKINVSEKKSLKTVVKKNKGKIITCVSCAAIVTAMLCMYKYNTQQIKNNAKTIEFVRDVVKEGALEEAIATVNRKIAYRIGKIEGCDKHNSEIALIAKKRYEEEVAELIIKLNQFKKEYDSIKIK